MNVPIELQRLQQKGSKPIVLGPSVIQGKPRELILCKIPADDTTVKTSAFTLQPYTEPVDEPEADARPYLSQPQSHTHHSHQSENNTPLLLASNDGPRWVGRKEAANRGSQNFVLFDRGSHYEIVPVQSTYNFNVDILRSVGSQEAADLERQQRARLAREAAADMALMNRTKRMEDDDDEEMMRSSKKRGRNEVDDTSYGAAENTMSVNQQKKLRLKKILRRKRAQKDLDIGETAASSLAFGEVRKAEVDWDFDDGGIATDDEEQAVMSDHEAVEEDVEDVEDSEEEKEEQVLTGYGENLTRLLENQREVEADDELAQFSDEEDEDDGSPGGSSVPGSPAKNQPKEEQGRADPTAQSELAIRERIISLMNANSNKLQVRSLLEGLGVTAKNSRFLIVKKVISDICDVTQEAGEGGAVNRFFELKQQYR